MIVLAAVAPRVSVARTEVFDRTVMFARAFVVREGTTARRETLVVRRMEIGPVAKDSLRARAMWTRPLPVAVSDKRVEKLIVIRRH